MGTDPSPDEDVAVVDTLRRWWGRRGRAARVSLVVVLLVSVVAVGAAAWLSQPRDVEPYSDPVSAESRVQNTVLYSSLQAAGINESVPSVTDDRVSVAYQLPDYAYDPDGSVNDSAALEIQRFVVGAAVDTAPEVDQLVILQYDGAEPHLRWTVAMADFDAFVSGDLTLAEFEGRIEVVTY